MASSEFVTGIQVFIVGTEKPGGAVATQEMHIPHAVPAAAVGTDRPQAVCGIFVDEVLAEMPFPPTQSPAMPRPACADCLAVVGTAG
jgi:hypothetical protein